MAGNAAIGPETHVGEIMGERSAHIGEGTRRVACRS
jgi:hypothetical protein